MLTVWIFYVLYITGVLWNLDSSSVQDAFPAEPILKHEVGKKASNDNQNKWLKE